MERSADAPGRAWASRANLEAAMRRLVERFITDEKGTTAVEYGLIATLIWVAIIGVLGTIGINLSARLGEIGDAVTSAGT
jgi:pilus assembly protein Flp/PilA